MKKLLYLLTLSIFVFTSCCKDAKTYIPDEEFEQWLICSGYDDIIDHYVLTKNIINIKEVHFFEPDAWSPCPDYGAIHDFTGIEDFRDLEVIKMDEVPIETIDLSKNLNLKSVDFYYAYKLKTLDLSKNTALISLILDIYVLEQLNLKNGNNTALHFSVDGSLPCIQVDDAAWSTANWTVDPPAVFSEDCGYLP